MMTQNIVKNVFRAKTWNIKISVPHKPPSKRSHTFSFFQRFPYTGLVKEY